MNEQVEIIDVVNFSDCTPENLDKRVTNVVELLKQKGETIATAESCTGGMLSACLTAVDGASAVFECGVCTYSNRCKQLLLHVPEEILAAHGAVSWQTAHAMSVGIGRLSNADLTVSITGIAGPTGGTLEKPVGTVFVGMDYHGRSRVYALKLWYAMGEGRTFNREVTVAFVLKTAEKLLMEEIS